MNYYEIEKQMQIVQKMCCVCPPTQFRRQNVCMRRQKKNFAACVFLVVSASLVGSAALPPGMEDYHLQDFCGESVWVGFASVLASGSIESVRSALAPLVADPSLGLRCATAVASGCRMLALIDEQNGHSVRALRLHQLSTIFLSFDFTMKGSEWINESHWGVKWEESVGGVLGAMVRFHGRAEGGWREKTMREVLESREGHQRPSRIAIVTVCEYDSSQTPLAALSKANKQRYADKHGYSLFFFDHAPLFEDWFRENGQMYPSRPPAWSKIDAVLEVMSSGKFEWTMWMDCDSFFMDPGLKLESVVNVGEKKMADFEAEISNMQTLKNWQPKSHTNLLPQQIEEYNRLAEQMIAADQPPEPLVSLITSEDGLMLNTGIFFVRTCTLAFHFLQRVRQLTFMRNPTTFHSWWEQTGMMLLLFGEAVFENDSKSDDLDYPPYTHFYAQKQLNVYPPLIASMLKTHVAYEEGDFIVSFSGCKIYTSQAVCNNLFLDYAHRAASVGSVGEWVRE